MDGGRDPVRSSPDGPEAPVRLAQPQWFDIVGNARVIALPLHVQFRGLHMREAVLIQGPLGWGEFAPFDDYAPPEAAWWLDSAIEAAYLAPPAAVRTQVPVNAIVPGADAVTAGRLAARAAAAGYRTIKVKVGGDIAADVARVRAVRTEFPGAIRVDANGAWSVTEAQEAIEALVAAADALEYIEQPCPTLAELAELRTRVSVPIAADESIRRADDPLAAAAQAAADVLVIKAAPLGGVRRALRVIAQAQVPVVVSSALDTGVGLAAGVALAAAVPQLAGDCGLGTGDLFADEVVTNPPLPVLGALPADYRGQLDQAALIRAEGRVSAERRRWWLERLAAAWSAGTSRRLPRLLADSSV